MADLMASNPVTLLVIAAIAWVVLFRMIRKESRWTR